MTTAEDLADEIAGFVDYLTSPDGIWDEGWRHFELRASEWDDQLRAGDPNAVERAVLYASVAGVLLVDVATQRPRVTDDRPRHCRTCGAALRHPVRVAALLYGDRPYFDEMEIRDQLASMPGRARLLARLALVVAQLRGFCSEPCATAPN